jgi:hypothetical protein
MSGGVITILAGILDWTPRSRKKTPRFGCTCYAAATTSHGLAMNVNCPCSSARTHPSAGYRVGVEMPPCPTGSIRAKMVLILRRTRTHFYSSPHQSYYRSCLESPRRVPESTRALPPGLCMCVCGEATRGVPASARASRPDSRFDVVTSYGAYTTHKPARRFSPRFTDPHHDLACDYGALNNGSQARCQASRIQYARIGQQLAQ